MAEIIPDEGLDYMLGALLAGATVDTTLYLGLFTSQSATTVPSRSATGGASPAGLTIDSDTNTTTTATVWLSGGTLTVTYQVTNKIVTTGRRTDERSLLITMVDT